MRLEHRRRGASGFSLFEMLVVIVMIGLMSLFAFPRVVQVFDQSQVRGARQAVLNKFNTARMNARQSGRSTFLVRNGTVFWIERSPRVTPLIGSTRDTVGG
jgi:prepilin-type N-terminal cleavage/methylation domain-containing protein